MTAPVITRARRHTAQSADATAAYPAGVRWAPYALYIGAAFAGVLAVSKIVSDASSGGPGIYGVTLWLAGFAAALLGREAATTGGQALLAQWRTLLSREHYIAGAKFGALLFQLALLLGIVRLFRVESPAFYDKLLILTIVGFVLHYCLPLRHRLSFFLALSLSGVLLVFGWTAATWLIALGLLLVGLCHIPAPMSLRIGLVVAFTAVLALFRAGVVSTLIPEAIWPILGSMFMFRLIVYVYHLRHDNTPTDWRRSLSYFFLLPNIVFPLFPVVDWAMFRRTYYDTERHAIYQRGIQWMFRGVVHLLIYRLVYLRFTIAPSDVTNGIDLARFMVGSFLLYLRVSGQFHLIVGMLHLFGFRLPETHRFFFLASSFTDFWRRINIYWKDFMMKVVYYPTFFRLRRWGTTAAILGATAMVFVGTWFFHAYQWFWLLGSFLLSWPDVLFWAILAVLLMANTIVEVKRGRERVLPNASSKGRQLGRRALQTAAFLAFMCMLWSFWSSDSVGEWLSLWRVLGRASISSIIQALLLVTATLMSLRFLASHGPRLGGALVRGQRVAVLLRPAVATTASLLLVYGLANVALTQGSESEPEKMVRVLQASQLNAADAVRLQRGYYEELTTPNPASSQLWEVFAGVDRNEKKPLHLTDLVRLTGDLRHLELKPELRSRHRGVPFATNRWGMRDREYDRTRPPNTVRIALLGQSYVLGIAVPAEQTFPKLLEEQLNEAHRSSGVTIEVMNFAMVDQQPVRQLLHLRKLVLGFKPDIVVSIAHHNDIKRLPLNVAHALVRNEPVPFPFLQAIIDSVNAGKESDRAELARRLTPYSTTIYRRVHEEFARECLTRGIMPVWVLLPTPDVGLRTADVDTMQAIALATGFRDLDLFDVYGPASNAKRFWNEDWDVHPNAAGHALIARRLVELFGQRPELLHKVARRSNRPPAPHDIVESSAGRDTAGAARETRLPTPTVTNPPAVEL